MENGGIARRCGRAIQTEWKSNKRLFVLSFLSSVLFCLCLPVNDLYAPAGRLMPYQPTPALFLGIVSGWLGFFALYWRLSVKIPSAFGNPPLARGVTPLPSSSMRGDVAAASGGRRLKVRPYMLYLIAPVVASVLSCIALYPGIFSIDSLTQLEQAMGKVPYNAWHPVGHTLLFFTIPYQLTGQILSVTVAHLLLYCFTWAYLFYTLERLGFKRRWLLVIQTLIVFIPTHLFLSMSMWKDIPFTCAGVILTANLIRLKCDPSRLQKAGFLLGTGAALGLLTVMRHNGPIIAPMIALLFLLSYRKDWRKALVPIGTAAVLFASVQFVGFTLLHAKPNPSAVSYRWFTQIAAGILKDGGRASQDDLDKLAAIMPLEEWTGRYNPYLNDPLFMVDIPGYKVTDTVEAHKGELVSATLSLSLKNPLKAVNAELRVTELTWRVLPLGPVNVTSYINRLDAYGLQIKQDTPLFSVWHDAMETMRTDYVLSVFFTRHGLWFCLTVFLLCLAFLRRSRRALVCFAPVLLNVMSLWVSIPSQDYRYVYLTVFAFPLLAGMMFNKKGETTT